MSAFLVSKKMESVCSQTKAKKCLNVDKVQKISPKSKNTALRGLLGKDGEFTSQMSKKT